MSVRGVRSAEETCRGIAKGRAYRQAWKKGKRSWMEEDEERVDERAIRMCMLEGRSGGR